MLCCLETPWSNHHDAYNRQTGDGISSFPGNRRFVKTGGNALAAAPPQQNNNFQHQASGNGGDLVSVTVPPGVTAGQAIHVNAPDGSGRTVMATVPQGMGPGSTFMVEFPPSTPAPSVVSSSVMSSTHATPQAQQIDPVDYSQVTAMPPPIEEPFAQAVPIGAPPGATTISPTAGHHAPPPPAPFGQPMLRVQVPPGTAPGTTLHVQVPGENRTIPAQVPQGGVSSFHVPYDAQAPPQSQQPVAPPGEKLLLVQVPPGTAPGASLHVSIPDEPGRVIAATVPPGNVSQFHVSYRPGVVQSAAPPTIMPPPRNSNNGYNRYNNNRNNNNRNSGGGGLGGMLLPALGGAALGAAAVSMYDHSHYHHNNGYNDGNAYGGDGDYGGDYGGGDYGGGDYGGADDHGGGDFGGFGDFGGDF